MTVLDVGQSIIMPIAAIAALSLGTFGVRETLKIWGLLLIMVVATGSLVTLTEWILTWI